VAGNAFGTEHSAEIVAKWRTGEPIRLLQRDLSRFANLTLTAANNSSSSSAIVEDNFVHFAFPGNLKSGTELDASSVLPTLETKVSRDIMQTIGLSSLPRNL